MVVGPIIAHVSVNNNLPLITRESTWFLAKCCPGANHPWIHAASTGGPGSFLPHAFYGTGQLLRTQPTSPANSHSPFDEPSLSSFVLPWQDSSVCRQRNKSIQAWINKSVANQKTNIHLILRQIGYSNEHQGNKDPIVQEGSCCAGIPIGAVVHRLGKVACSSSEFTV